MSIRTVQLCMFKNNKELVLYLVILIVPAEEAVLQTEEVVLGAEECTQFVEAHSEEDILWAWVHSLLEVDM